MVAPSAFISSCRFNPTLGGTTDWTYSSLVQGYNTPTLGGAITATPYSCRAESNDLSQWEESQGLCTITGGVPTFARTTVLYNSSGTGTGPGQSGAGTKISFSTVPQVAIVALAEDLLSFNAAMSLTATQQAQARNNIGVPSIMRSYLAGLTLSTPGGSASFSVAAGVATDSTNADVMSLAASLTKSTSAWSVGAGGALDTGVIANQWYYPYLIKRPDTGVVDVCFSASASAPTFGVNIPAAYTLYRRIGSIFKPSSVWAQFTQLGDEFIWTSPVQDQNLVGTLGTTAQLLTLASVPSGFQVVARIRVNAFHASLIAAILLTSPDETDNPPGTPAGNYNVVSFAAGVASGIEMMTRTSATGQVRARANNASTNLQIIVIGFTDRRGRDA